MSASSSVSSSGCWATYGCTHWTWGQSEGRREGGGTSSSPCHPSCSVPGKAWTPPRLAGQARLSDRAVRIPTATGKGLFEGEEGLAPEKTWFKPPGALKRNNLWVKG